MPDDELASEVDDIGGFLVLEQREDGAVEVDDPSRKLSENDRIAIIVKALFTEMGEDLVAILAACQDDEDE